MTLAEAPSRKPERVEPEAPAPPAWRRPPPWPVVNLVAALAVSIAVLYASFFGAGPLPALGAAFNPVTGAWTMAEDAQVTGATLHLAGLQRPASAVFEPDGTAHITAQTDHDLFLATGYVHAKFRLFQMDLMRRQGEGRLSEVAGAGALDSDRFELQLGLLRTARAEWTAMSGYPRALEALTAYAQGVNDRIAEAESSHQLDAMFTLLGYRPQRWTPVDTLVIKGDMTQTLNFTDTPLAMALLERSLGPDLTAKWFPILPPNAQSPYDPGPYAAAAPPQQIVPVCCTTEAATAAITDAYQRLAALPPGLLARGGESNNWAVAGTRSVSGGALMAGDPHLHLTLPAIWFQMTQDSPGYHTAGVAIPGTPGVLIGHNQHISWSLTDAQNQQTFFYLEHQDGAHPGQYLWNGAWRKFELIDYDIPVLGGETHHLTVKLTVHGPVITERGQTTSVWWAGNIPSQDLDVLLGVNQASDWQQFRDALRGWYSPTHNFVYADDRGHIGLISAGYFPLVANPRPWLPMPGTGESDVTGTIPFDQIPQRFDPPDGIIWSANQRQVTGGYPYYIGTTTNFFDPGYRANEIYSVLSRTGKLSAADMQALQTDTRDYLATEIVPALVDALAHSTLSPADRGARDLLASWDHRMDTGSQAATIWWTFWQRYIKETFTPWWTSRHVKVDMAEVSDALGQDLEAWTMHDQHNPVFALGGQDQTAAGVMMVAFHQAVAQLSRQLGPNESTWTWGRVHSRVLENLALISGLDYGPRPERGDANTPLAAGGYRSTSGPSWRMVVDWGTHSFSGVFPGGQSENPASDWYANRADTWFEGGLDPMLTAGQAAARSGAKHWDLRP